MWTQAAGIVVVSLAATFAGFAAGGVLLGVGTAMVYPTLLAAIGNVARPSWRASAIGVYRLWRDLGYALGAVVAGVSADALGLRGAVWVVAGLTLTSGLVVGVRMTETWQSAAAGQRAVGDSEERQFSVEKVAKELRSYRRKGAGSTTRLLRDGLAETGLTSGELLDVGAGFGALTFELLDRGMSRATVVEMSSAYLAAATEEAARRGRSSSVHPFHGDFVTVAPTLPATTVVTLDRVMCCYPSPELLLEQALRHAERGIALS